MIILFKPIGYTNYLNDKSAEVTKTWLKKYIIWLIRFHMSTETTFHKLDIMDYKELTPLV